MKKQAALDIGLLIHQFLVWTTVRVRLCCGATWDSITTCKSMLLHTSTDSKQTRKAGTRLHCKLLKHFTKFPTGEFYQTVNIFFLCTIAIWVTFCFSRLPVRSLTPCDNKILGNRSRMSRLQRNTKKHFQGITAGYNSVKQACNPLTGGGIYLMNTVDKASILPHHCWFKEATGEEPVWKWRRINLSKEKIRDTHARKRGKSQSLEIQHLNWLATSPAQPEEPASDKITTFCSSLQTWHSWSSVWTADSSCRCLSEVVTLLSGCSFSSGRDF